MVSLGRKLLIDEESTLVLFLIRKVFKNLTWILYLQIWELLRWTNAFLAWFAGGSHRTLRNSHKKASFPMRSQPLALECQTGAWAPCSRARNLKFLPLRLCIMKFRIHRYFWKRPIKKKCSKHTTKLCKHSNEIAETTSEGKQNEKHTQEVWNQDTRSPVGAAQGSSGSLFCVSFYPCFKSLSAST